MIPIITAPTPGADGVDNRRVVLEWEGDGPFELECQIDDPDVNGHTFSMIDYPHNYYTVAGLMPGKTYYWRVRQAGDNDWAEGVFETA